MWGWYEKHIYNINVQRRTHVDNEWTRYYYYAGVLSLYSSGVDLRLLRNSK